MVCHCFNNILPESEDFPSLPVVSYLQFEKELSSKLYWEIKQHQNLKSISHSTIKKLKKDKCIKKKIQLIYLQRLLKKHWTTINMLEVEVNKSKQHELKINVNQNFHYLLGKRCEIVKYMKCLKEYIGVKSQPLTIYGLLYGPITDFEIEHKNHQFSLQLLELFSSFKDFYSADFDSENEAVD